MNADFEHLRQMGRQRGEGPQATLRHDLLEGLLRRLARLPGRDSLVLRGGLLTRFWVAPLPRPTRDLDFVGDFSFNIEETIQRVRPLLTQASDDGLVLDPDSFRATGTWLHTDFPGVRICLAMGHEAPDQEVTLDIGFGDPLVPEAAEIDYPTLRQETLRLRAVRPETQVAWKLHGLAEQGESWRPKDLADLWRILQQVSIESAVMPQAVEAAFLSRGFSLEDAASILLRDFWSTKTARVRWGSVRGVPNLAATLAAVRGSLDPLLRPLANCSDPHPRNGSHHEHP